MISGYGTRRLERLGPDVATTKAPYSLNLPRYSHSHKGRRLKLLPPLPPLLGELGCMGCIGFAPICSFNLYIHNGLAPPRYAL